MKLIKMTTLDTICPGQRACVESLHCAAGLHRRLTELGFIENTELQCLYRGPCGSPIAFYVRGAVIALRACDATKISAHLC